MTSTATIRPLSGSISGTNGTITDSAGASTLTLSNPGSYTLSPLLSGLSLSLTQSGTGIVTLSQTEQYSGATTINAGTIAEGIDNALPTTTSLTVAGGAFLDLSGHNQTLTAVIGGNKTITDSGGGVHADLEQLRQLHAQPAAKPDRVCR